VKFLSTLAVVLALCGCNRQLDNKEAVRQAVLDYYRAGRSDVNISAMNVDVTSVAFRKNEADATVSFHAKDSGGPGMEMKYTLERQGSKWVVKSKSGVGGSAHGTAAGDAGLPPGHPPTSDRQQ
jgi:hypothetical protein